MFATASSQFSTLSDIVGQFALRFQPYRGAPLIAFFIKGGLQDKCCSRLQLDQIKIGSGFGSDITLVDPSIGGQHLDVDVVHSMLGPLAKVTALGGDVTVNGQAFPKGDATKFLKLPLLLDLGNETSIEIRSGSKRPIVRRSRMQRLSSSASLTLLIAALSFFAWDTLDGRNFQLRAPQADIATTQPVANQSGVTIENLVDRLTQANLNNSVTVIENSDGILEVSGRLTNAQWRNWQDVAIWYDEVSLGRPMVSALFVGVRFKELPPISMLNLSDPKKIILATGQSLSINDVFSGDWRVADIQNDKVIVTRGDETEILQFAGVEN